MLRVHMHHTSVILNPVNVKQSEFRRPTLQLLPLNISRGHKQQRSCRRPITCRAFRLSPYNSQSHAPIVTVLLFQWHKPWYQTFFFKSTGWVPIFGKPSGLHGALDVDDDGVPDQLRVLRGPLARDGLLLQLWGTGVLHQGRQGGQRLPLPTGRL